MSKHHIELKHHLDDTIPGWFDLSLIEIYNKKRDRTKIRRGDRCLDALLRASINCLPSWITHVSHHNYSWLDIEEMIREVCVGVKEDDYHPDIIIGIKSGGAFIAKYAAMCLEVSAVGYMRVSHYSDKTRSVAKSLAQVNRDAVISEPLSMPVQGKKVLVVDDQLAKGTSINAAKAHILGQGAAEVRAFCLFSNKRSGADYYRRRGLAMYFPWGKDA